MTKLGEGDDAVLAIEGFGRKSLIDLKKKLRQLGYELPAGSRRSRSLSAVYRKIFQAGSFCTCLKFLICIIAGLVLELIKTIILRLACQKQIGSLEVVCGSMFCGKTDELIRRLRRAVIARKKVQVFKPAIDMRYSAEKINSHAGSAFDAIPIATAREILSLSGSGCHCCRN